MENKFKTYVLDIETKPQADLVNICASGIKAPKTYKDEAKISAYIEQKKLDIRKKMSVDTDYSEIICIGIKEVGGEAALYSLVEFSEFLKVHTIDGYLTCKFVTYNGKKFDFPVIIKSAIKNKIELPFKDLKEMTGKYKVSNHYDLIELNEYGNFKSLDIMLQIYLGISKKPVDFDTASEAEIKEHCLEDLINTEKLFNLFKPSL